MHNVTAATDTDIASISRAHFENAIGGRIQDISSDNDAIGLLRQVQLLRCMPDDIFHSLVKSLHTQVYNDKDIIVQQNNPGTSFYIIKEGSVDVFRDNAKIRTIQRLDYFGERSVLFNNFRSATASASGRVV
jgi:CRP-like cAMP-binding protein